jgi:hypothetical protein
MQWPTTVPVFPPLPSPHTSVSYKKEGSTWPPCDTGSNILHIYTLVPPRLFPPCVWRSRTLVLFCWYLSSVADPDDFEPGRTSFYDPSTFSFSKAEFGTGIRTITVRDLRWKLPHPHYDFILDIFGCDSISVAEPDPDFFGRIRIRTSGTGSRP